MTATFIASLDTDVPATRSVGHIQELVEKFGARSFQTVYSRTTGRPESIRFVVVDPHVPASPELLIGLSAPTGRIVDELRRRSKRHQPLADVQAKAERIAWRHLHDFVRASLIGVQDGLLSVGEAFLANLVVDGPHGEERFGDALARANLLVPTASGRLALPPGRT